MILVTKIIIIIRLAMRRSNMARVTTRLHKHCEEEYMQQRQKKIDGY